MEFFSENGISGAFLDETGAQTADVPTPYNMDGAYNGAPNLADPATLERMDAKGGIHPYGSFTETLAEVLRPDYEPLTANKLFPVHTPNNPWVEKIRQHTISGSGEAKIVCGCDANFPTVNLEGRTFETGVVSLGVAYNICYQTEMQQMYTPGLVIDYERELMATAFRALQEEINRLAFYGDTKRNLLGVFNNPYIPKQISPYALDETVSDPQAIVRVLQLASSKASVNSRGAVRTPDTMAIAPSLLNSLRARFANTADGGCCDKNVLDKLQQAAPYLRYLIEVPELEAVGPRCERAVFFYRRDKRDLQWNIPSTLIVPPPERVNMRRVVRLMARVGSVWFKRPETATLLVGV